MTKHFVLDACALIALLQNEEGDKVVDEIIEKAQEQTISVSMNKFNLLEVYYGTYRRYGKEQADTTLQNMAYFPIKIISEIANDVFKEAGRLKGTYKISIADSIALAEASVSGGALLTCDHHEMDIIEKSENIKFLWIR